MGRGTDWEVGIDIYTLLYIKEITCKDQLRSTRNSIQYSIMTHMGKNIKKSGYCVCITGSLCHTLETKTIL